MEHVSTVPVAVVLFERTYVAHVLLVSFPSAAYSLLTKQTTRQQRKKKALFPLRSMMGVMINARLARMV